MNSFGQYFRITTFGESHGWGLGVVVDGCPAGLELDLAYVQQRLDRRRPGQSALVSQRKEGDRVRIVSGWREGRTMGTPLCLLIENEDARSRDYEAWSGVFRPSHADFTYHLKYRGWHDHRGGGRASARETAARVAGGAVAETLLKHYYPELKILAYVSQIGGIELPPTWTGPLDAASIEAHALRCPHPPTAQMMEELVRATRKRGDSVGGIVTAKVANLPAGLGQPLFGKLQALLAGAMLSIPAARGFEYGSGFQAAQAFGSEHNDPFYLDPESGTIKTRSNHSGGIQGGISNGMDLDFRVAFKPVATLMQSQETVNVQGQSLELQGQGRHDPCVLPRAVPIVEAMTALVLADCVLASQAWGKLGPLPNRPI